MDQLKPNPSSIQLVAQVYRSGVPGTRVLLAEDDEDLRELFEDALEQAGFSVLSVAGGKQALAAFSSASIGSLPPPDCIVMDIRMPGYSGLELLMALELAEWKVPVILVTGFGDEETHAKAEAYGCFAILDKPVTPNLLVQKVTDAVASAYLPSGDEPESKRPLPMSFFGT